MSKIVAKSTMGNFGWQLMMPAKSTLEVKDLGGEKIAITAAGSGSDLLALWTARTTRSISPACRSAAAAWCRTCWRAMSMRPWCIRRSASRF